MAENRLKTTHLTASGSISGTNIPAQVVAWHCVGGASAGTAIFRNGGSSGSAVMTIDMPASATSLSDGHLPGLGVLFQTDCYCTLANVGFMTVWWY